MIYAKKEPSPRTVELRRYGLVHVQEAARHLGIRPGVLTAYMESGVVPHFTYRGIPVMRRAMLPLILEAIMEARDGRPFDLGKKNMPGLREY